MTSTTTTHLNLPYLAAGQAMKHVTHNDALDKIDALLFLATETAGANAPPASPTEGERHIIGPAPTGVWAGQAGAIALMQDSAWTFLTPQPGWQAWSADTGTLFVFDGTDWAPLTSSGTSEMLGIHTTADATNRLAVASAASLFTHDGAGHRIKVNKAAVGETASLLFQTGYSGRAEMGLAGNDQFQIKVSADGSNWTQALSVSGDGKIGINTASATAPLTVSGSDTSGLVPDLQVVRNSTWALAWYETYSSDSAFHAPFSIMRRARGSTTSPASVQAGDQIGGFSFRAYGPGGSFQQTALINAVVSGTPASGSVPTDMTLCAGSTGANERMRITAGGDIGIATASPSTRLHVNGPVRVGSSTIASLPPAATVGAGTIVYCSNAAGGAELAFSDGTNWRKASDRSIIA